MSEFTYEIPNEQNFLQAIIIYLRQKNRQDIVSLLDGCKCSITHDGQFSHIRWNGYSTTVTFEVPMNRYEHLMSNMTDEKRDVLKSVCNEVMPTKNGLDVMEILIQLSLDDISAKKDLMSDLDEISDKLPRGLKSDIIPDDIKEKAKQMSEIYRFLYYVENALRAFIEKISKENYGNDYISKLNLNSQMQKKIRIRKKSKEKIKWLSLRGDSDIFYLDIDDLGNVIKNNWDIFKKYFESQDWVVINIKEIADCRHPIAHNCYLAEHEREVIRINFVKLMKQISEAFEE